MEFNIQMVRIMMRRTLKNLSLLLVIVGAFSACNKEKSAYINNTRVVSEYQSMKDAEARWTKKNDELKAELEVKAKGFQEEVQDFESKVKSMSQSKQEELANALRGKQQNLQREQQTRIQEIQKKSGEEIDGIVDEVKNYIKEYGKKHGYTYIYGDTEASTILYAKKELDITDLILDELNKGMIKEPLKTTPTESTKDISIKSPKKPSAE